MSDRPSQPESDPARDQVSGQASGQAIRGAIHRQAFSIVLAVAPFGIVFGATAAAAGLTIWEAAGFSALVFTGASQFAAVEILRNGGSIASATIAGLLLSVRSLAFGIIMAPALTGKWWQRAWMSQLMIDESTAVGSAQSVLRWRRYGFVVTGVGIFIVWNLTTVVGYAVFSGSDDLIKNLGLDCAAPAAFLALLWPRLSSPPQRRTAIAGGLIALVLIPFVPAGVPILAAMFGVLAAGSTRSASDESVEVPS
jgi:predicted branched-subunit amino acid permease